MNVTRFNQDLKLLQAFQGRENVTWSTNPHDLYIVIKNLRLPDNIRPNITSVKIPVPANMYDPAGSGRFHYYRNVYVDPGLQVLHPNGHWGPVPRHHDLPVTGNDMGWRFLCLYPSGTVGSKQNIMEFVRLLQVWFKNCLKLN